MAQKTVNAETKRYLEDNHVIITGLTLRVKGFFE